MSRWKIWFLAIRPNTLVVGLSPVLIGTAISMTQGFFQLFTFLFTLLTSLGIQIVCNLANDYFDFLKGADTEARIGPLRVTQAGLVSLPGMKKALWVTISLTIATGSYLIFQGGFVFALLVILALLLAVSYTGGPFPLAYLGIGQIFTFLFFGPIATFCTYFLQTSRWDLPASIAGLIPGLISAAILTSNNLRDLEEDRAASKNTIVVKYGIKFGKGFYCITLLLSALVPVMLIPYRPFVLLSLLTFPPIALLCLQVIKIQERSRYHVILANTAQLLLMYTLIFCVSYML